METRFKEDERVQIRNAQGPTAPLEGKTGTVIAIVPYEDFHDYWVKIDLGQTVQVSERELIFLGN